MNKLSVLTAGAMIALAAFAAACGDGDDPDSAAGDGSQAVSPGGGALVVPNTFLTYEGAQYELVQFLQADFEDESEFHPIGEATDADIDLTGGNVVYERDGDADGVYTLSPGTVDDVAFWLRWRRE